MITPNNPKFYHEYFGCRICPGAQLYDDAENGPRPIFDEGCDNPSFVLVGLNPGKDEVKLGRPFVGMAGKALRQLMAEAQEKWQRRSSSEDTPLVRGLLVNMAKCQFLRNGSGENRTPTDEEYANCRPIFDKMWNYLKPKIVLLCGGDVLNKFGVEGGMTQLCGSVRNLEYLDNKFYGIPIFHPSYYCRLQKMDPAKSISVHDKIIETLITTADLVIKYEMGEIKL